MRYYKVSIFTYEEYIKENSNNRLTKFEKLFASKGIPKYLKIDKIFDREINEQI